jgi:predicted HTH transcriptional regulator
MLRKHGKKESDGMKEQFTSVESLQELTEAVRALKNGGEAALTALLLKLVNEKERNAQILERIQNTLGELNERLKKLETILDAPTSTTFRSPTSTTPKVQQKKEEMDRLQLSSQDRKILEIVREKGKICAFELQKIMKYRGRNAASARLNKLYREGFLEKKVQGRQIYFFLKE